MKSTAPTCVLEVIATDLSPFLDMDDVVSLAHVNRALRQLVWENQDVWKAIVLAQFMLFPQQDLEELLYADPILDEHGVIMPSCSWQQMALSLNNVVKGRYRFLKIDQDGSYEAEDENYCAAEESSEDYSHQDDSMLIEDTLSFVDDDVPPESPSTMIIDGMTVRTEARVWFGGSIAGYSCPHRWWSDSLYTYVGGTENCPLPPHMVDWLPYTENHVHRTQPWFFADPTMTTKDGYLVCSVLEGTDLSNPLLLVDLCDGDRIVHKFTEGDNGYTSTFQQGESVAVDADLIVLRSDTDCSLHWDLGKEVMQSFHADRPWDNVYGNYGWSMHSRTGGCLQFLDRKASLVTTVYSSTDILLRIARTIWANGGVAEGALIRPGSTEPSMTRTEAQRASEIQVSGIAVTGKLLVLSVTLNERFCVFMVDMKRDALLYGIFCLSCPSYPPWGLRSGSFRGGILSIYCDGPLRQVFDAGILFSPTIPALDPTHTRLFQLFVQLECSKEPILQHPSLRRPLNELVGCSTRRLCDSTEQQFLIRLFYEFYERNIPGHPVTQLVCRNNSGVYTGEKFGLHDLRPPPCLL